MMISSQHQKNVHTVAAGLSGESVMTTRSMTRFCFDNAFDAFVATLCFVALVLCRVERPVWQLK
jgi:hypothetical protein